MSITAQYLVAAVTRKSQGTNVTSCTGVNSGPGAASRPDPGHRSWLRGPGYRPVLSVVAWQGMSPCPVEAGDEWKPVGHLVAVAVRCRGQCVIHLPAARKPQSRPGGAGKHQAGSTRPEVPYVPLARAVDTCQLPASARSGRPAPSSHHLDSHWLSGSREDRRFAMRCCSGLLSPYDKPIVAGRVGEDWQHGRERTPMARVFCAASVTTGLG